MVHYKEYFEEGISLQRLRSEWMPKQEFRMAHQSLVLFCHDIFVEYDGGILLILRNNEPARDVPWPLGGRVLRGMDVAESAIKKAKEESNLEVSDLKLLGICRTYFRTDPFGHGHGTDSVNAVFYGKGQGELKLDKLHEHPMIIKPEDCTSEFMDSLVPYVRDYLTIAMSMVKGES